jgi:hypothetical protein
MSMHEIRRGARLVAAIALTLSVTVSCARTLGVIPSGLQGEIENARRSLEENWERPVPVSFTFVGTRCRADGGLLLTFEQRGVIGSEGLAIAMRGPTAVVDGWEAWGGGFAPIDPRTHPEVLAFFSSAPEVPCPA